MPPKSAECEASLGEIRALTVKALTFERSASEGLLEQTTATWTDFLVVMIITYHLACVNITCAFLPY